MYYFPVADVYDSLDSRLIPYYRDSLLADYRDSRLMDYLGSPLKDSLERLTYSSRESFLSIRVFE